MKYICLDEKCIVYEPLKELKKVKPLDTNTKYQENLNNIFQAISKDASKNNVSLLYDSIPNIKIKKSIARGIILNMIVDHLLGEYDMKNNRIYLYKNNAAGSTLNHEVLHLVSSYYNEEKDTYYCGFRQEGTYYSVGEAINEGYTEYQNKEIFNENISNTYYKYEIILVKLLEKIIGKEKMKDMYYHADLYNLINTLSNYTTLGNIKNFLYKSDHILNKRINILKNEEMNNYILDINHFLITTYSNYLLELKDKGCIYDYELDSLYMYFVEELEEILEVNLPINKKILYRNLRDNRLIHLERIKRKI